MRLILIIIWSLWLLTAGAQAKEEPISKADHPLAANKLNLKLDAANVVNPVDPSILLSLEYQFRTWVSFSQEVGTVMAVRDESGLVENGWLGFKLREELRFYLNTGSSENALGYLSFNALYRYLSLGESVTIGYGCEDSWQGSCDYLMASQSDVISHRYGGGVKVGLIKPVGDRLTIEADLGMNLLYLQLDRQETEGVTYYYNNDFLSDDQRGWRYEPSFNARIGYVLFKR